MGFFIPGIGETPKHGDQTSVYVPFEWAKMVKEPHEPKFVGE